MTVAGLPASTLTSKAAWQWTDTAPWSKRTVSTHFSYTGLGNGYFDEYQNMYIIDGDWVRLTLPESYDTDTYIAPVNVRISASCGTLHNRDESDYYIQPSFTFDLTSGKNDNWLVWGSLTQSPIINYPVPNPDTNYYWIRFRVSVPSDVPSYKFYSDTIQYTVTYDIYYRDSSGGALPDGWSENTTAPSATLPDDLPTVTTAVSPDDTAEQISGLLEFPSGLLDGMHYLRDTIAQFLGLRYVSFIVVLGLICALVAWFLH